MNSTIQLNITLPPAAGGIPQEAAGNYSQGIQLHLSITLPTTASSVPLVQTTLATPTSRSYVENSLTEREADLRKALNQRRLKPITNGAVASVEGLSVTAPFHSSSLQTRAGSEGTSSDGTLCSNGPRSGETQSRRNVVLVVEQGDLHTDSSNTQQGLNSLVHLPGRHIDRDLLHSSQNTAALEHGVVGHESPRPLAITETSLLTLFNRGDLPVLDPGVSLTSPVNRVCLPGDRGTTPSAPFDLTAQVSKFPIKRVKKAVLKSRLYLWHSGSVLPGKMSLLEPPVIEFVPFYHKNQEDRHMNHAPHPGYTEEEFNEAVKIYARGDKLPPSLIKGNVEINWRNQNRSSPPSPTHVNPPPTKRRFERPPARAPATSTDNYEPPTKRPRLEQQSFDRRDQGMPQYDTTPRDLYVYGDSYADPPEYSPRSSPLRHRLSSPNDSRTQHRPDYFMNAPPRGVYERPRDVRTHWQ
ncbi:SubName: Full=Uncharacterized protein {ECO:0000313/EMBL:CCA68181.1} [Serendipita indica DSM 11827]|nr:SubName: Full=Uncharacterized protein {ECO:0000313/EMBL:CCA68181.1} [Serendipita indica DSM 11827]